MRKIIVRPPDLPKLSIPQLHQKRITPPKLKIPKASKNRECVFGGLYGGIHTSARNSVIKRQELNQNTNSLLTEKTSRDEQQPILAGRGGTHCGKVSAMGRMEESGVKRTRQAKKEIKPYKPTPQMHTLYGLEDMRRY